MKEKDQKIVIFYIIPAILFILFFIYINNQVNISISYKKISAIKEKINTQENFHKKLLLEYYTSMSFNHMEKEAKKLDFKIISPLKDYKLVNIHEKK
ncbi:hypothetical protein J7L48_02145 [bacterium]|nr:hypothetical protein [bacterium]